jgi:hypothetical protein
MGAGAASYIAAHYRHTSLGGLTLPVAVRRAGNTITVVRPIGKSFSRSGTHGVFYFPADVDAIVYLLQSNSGRRSVYVRYLAGDADFCDMLRRCAHLLWVVRHLSVQDVIAALPSCH